MAWNRNIATNAVVRPTRSETMPHAIRPSALNTASQEPHRPPQHEEPVDLAQLPDVALPHQHRGDDAGGHDDERHVAQHHLLLGVGVAGERAEQRQQQQRHEARERGVRKVEHDEVIHVSGDEEATTQEEAADGGGEPRAVEVLHKPRDHHGPRVGENADRKRVLQVALLLGFAEFLRGIIHDHGHLAPVRDTRFQLLEIRFRDDRRKDLRVKRPPEDAVTVKRAEDKRDEDGADEDSGTARTDPLAIGWSRFW